MSHKLTLINVSEPIAVEYQGTKSKFWYSGENRSFLFKEGKIHGENWAEIIASELARLLELPSAYYLPAVNGEKRGVSTETFINEDNNERLIFANELFSRLHSDYETHKTWKQKEYELGTAFVILEKLSISKFELTCECNKYGLSPVEQFVGYLIFDCLIANQDRHHENWGLIKKQDGLILAPSYDHASSLACRESEDKRKIRLITKDKNFNIDCFATKAKTPFYNYSQEILKNRAVALECKRSYSRGTGYWKDRIGGITRNDIVTILDMLPDDWMTPIEKEFTIRLLEINRDFISAI